MMTSSTREKGWLYGAKLTLFSLKIIDFEKKTKWTNGGKSIRAYLGQDFE